MYVGESERGLFHGSLTPNLQSAYLASKPRMVLKTVDRIY